MLSFNKINRGVTSVTHPSQNLGEFVSDDGYHHVKWVSKNSIPIVPDDGGMTPHALRNNPSLMVTGTNIDCTPIEVMEDNLSILQDKIETVDVEQTKTE